MFSGVIGNFLKGFNIMGGDMAPTNSTNDTNDTNDTSTA